MPAARHPLQNRATPSGDLIAVPERGLFMGNRGNLHNHERQITSRRWTTIHWVTCLLEFKGRKRELMHPGYYTELFFLDEATAFAAGHRPCAECRRGDYNRFGELFRQVHPGEGRPRALELDTVLQAERRGPDRQQRRWQAALGSLADGVMVARAGSPTVALLWWHGKLWPWTPGGYAAPETATANETVSVLTPETTAAIFAAGYVPIVHPSASE